MIKWYAMLRKTVCIVVVVVALSQGVAADHTAFTEKSEIPLASEYNCSVGMDVVSGSIGLSEVVDCQRAKKTAIVLHAHAKLEQPLREIGAEETADSIREGIEANQPAPPEEVSIE